MSLPLFLTKTIVEAGVSSAKDCSFLVLSACRAFFETISNESNASSVKDTLYDALSYLWETVNQIIAHVPCALP